MVIYCKDICSELGALLGSLDYDRLFVLTDETTEAVCRPLLNRCEALKEAVSIVIGATDTHKNVETLVKVWTAMGEAGGTRHSLLVNLGGGMVTDLGGFAAASFKRGIRFINIPTTLLSMVDAAVGGKTGINFNGLKNEIGAFRESEAVLVDTQFLRTLDAGNLCSGYAEMLKHALLKGEKMWAEHLTFDLQNPDYDELQRMVADSIAVKENIVAQDPHEKGLRKALNLGHTTGHAFESLALARQKPVLHGYAVAWGLACELYLSARKTGFPVDKMRQTVNFIKENYGTFPITCDDYDAICNYMMHDKKNVAGVINFTLLSEVGQLCLDSHARREEIEEMLDFYREGC